MMSKYAAPVFADGLVCIAVGIWRFGDEPTSVDDRVTLYGSSGPRSPSHGLMLIALYMSSVFFRAPSSDASSS